MHALDVGILGCGTAGSAAAVFLARAGHTVTLLPTSRGLGSSERSALAFYSRRRSDHLAYDQLATRWLTPFFQGDARVLGGVRDVVNLVTARIPLLRRIMTLSMLGFAGRIMSLQLPRGAFAAEPC